ncbi:MAG: NUDIX domain-containing protein [Dehalococcoidia bacterium]
MTSGAKPTLRPGARVILLDPDDRILLIRAASDEMDEPVIWITPGGAIEDGESFEQAALRELWEETGIEDAELGPCVWLRDHVWRWGETFYDSRERFYLVRTTQTDVSPRHMEDLELHSFTGFRWWSVDELAASDEVFVPRNLAELLVPLIAGDVPLEPIEVGE